MKFKNFKKQNNKIVFNVKNVDVSILNSIRRVILSDIFNVAFEYKPYEFENRKVMWTEKILVGSTILTE